MTDDFTLRLSYRIEIRNETDGVITPCLYWTVPHDTSLQSVAWFAGAAAATTRLVREFQYVPGMFCTPALAKSGEDIVLSPGLVSRVVFAFNNSVQLSCPNGRYGFGTPRPHGSRDTLYLLQDASMAGGSASVGFSIDAHPALVTAAQAATMLAVPMALQLNVGLANVSSGAVLDLSEVQQATPIQLPQNVRVMYVTYGKDGQVALSQYVPRPAKPDLVQVSV
jgi:hypothetical protein